MIAFLMALSLLAPFSNASEVQVVSLFPVEGHRVGRLLSFAVEPVNGDPVDLTAVRLSVPKSTCNAQIDPYRNHYFHVVCADSVELDVEVVFSASGRSYITRLKGLQILPSISVAPTIVGPQPSPSPTPDETPVEKTIGEKIYQNDCRTCHRANPIGKGLPLSDYRSAFKRGDMRQFDGLFSNEELLSLKEYIDQK